jgi:hypothetical protein
MLLWHKRVCVQFVLCQRTNLFTQTLLKEIPPFKRVWVLFRMKSRPLVFGIVSLFLIGLTVLYILDKQVKESFQIASDTKQLARLKVLTSDFQSELQRSPQLGSKYADQIKVWKAVTPIVNTQITCDTARKLNGAELQKVIAYFERQTEQVRRDRLMASSAPLQSTMTSTSLAQPKLTSTSLAQPTMTSTSLAQPTMTNTSLAQPTMTSTSLAQPTMTSTSLAQPTMTSTSLAQPISSSDEDMYSPYFDTFDYTPSAYTNDLTNTNSVTDFGSIYTGTGEEYYN